MSLFTRLPVVSSDMTMPKVPDADITSYQAFEPGSYDHWMFTHGNAADLVGLANGTSLTTQTSVTHNPGYVRVSVDDGAGLLTGYIEDGQRGHTLWAVVREPALYSAISMVAGTYSSLAGGCMFFSTVDGARYLYENYIGFISNQRVAVPVSANSWYFTAVSVDPAAKAARLVLGNTVATFASGQSQYTDADRAVAFGNGYYALTTTAVMDFAEAGVFDTPLSAIELSALYLRAKARMASLGISI